MKWLIVAGGTGGHLMPGIALAEEILSEGEEVLFIAGNRNIERVILKNRPFRVEHLEVEGFLGRPLKDKLRALKKLIFSTIKAYKIIKAYNPQVILAEGGYVSVPVVLAGWLLRKKMALHEQNLIPGKANLLLSKFVDKIFISFPESKAFFPKGKGVIFSGNPVRRDLFQEKERVHQGIGLLVLGGSLGARFLNQLVLEIVEELFNAYPQLFLIHQTGLEDYEEVKRAYENLKIWEKYSHQIKIFPFIEDMGWAYRQADLVIGRAGATTIAEIIALKKPAIFIPFPYATYKHQEKNAEILVKLGGALMFKQEEFDKVKFLEKLIPLLGDKDKLKQMSRAYEGVYSLTPQRVILEEMRKIVKGA